MLLGMYRCTDVPGEFVWQPGTLTQAATKGHWILLEDIDYAPLDVVRHLAKPFALHILSLENILSTVPGDGLVFHKVFCRKLFHSYLPNLIKDI